MQRANNEELARELANTRIQNHVLEKELQAERLKNNIRSEKQHDMLLKLSKEMSIMCAQMHKVTKMLKSSVVETAKEQPTIEGDVISRSVVPMKSVTFITEDDSLESNREETTSGTSYLSNISEEDVSPEEEESLEEDESPEEVESPEEDESPEEVESPEEDESPEEVESTGDKHVNISMPKNCAQTTLKRRSRGPKLIVSRRSTGSRKSLEKSSKDKTSKRGCPNKKETQDNLKEIREEAQEKKSSPMLRRSKRATVNHTNLKEPNLNRKLRR